MNLQEVVKAALAMGLRMNAADKRLNLLGELATRGPRRARRLAIRDGCLEVFDRSIIKNLIPKFRAILNGKGRQIGAIVYDDEPVNKTIRISEALKDGYLVFDRGRYAELHAA